MTAEHFDKNNPEDWRALRAAIEEELTDTPADAARPAPQPARALPEDELSPIFAKDPPPVGAPRVKIIDRLTTLGTSQHEQWWLDYYEGGHVAYCLYRDGTMTGGGGGGSSLDGVLARLDDEPHYQSGEPMVGWIISQITREGMKPVACSHWDTPDLHERWLQLRREYKQSIYDACTRVLHSHGLTWDNR
jgi:hypothetical protein